MPIFTGPGAPLSAAGFHSATALNGIESASLWAVLSVETSGCGYLADRRPKILFERHVFHRLTGGKHDAAAPDVSAPTQGGYGPGGAHQYDRLAVALKLDQSAALKSASWGLGQVMGENFASAGFPNVDTMVADMVEGEDAQLQGMAAFIKTNGMNAKLQSHDWAGFARAYNGPDYAANNYDGLLRQFYSRYSNGDLPDLSVRAAQAYLTYKGFSPGAVDGIAGVKTIAAVKAFQASIGVVATGVIDAKLLQQLAR